ncbi:MAG: hypothetical protein IPJ30_23100 [Acidobacteria bacterium]|nr:hypothetical protein [Acidobacteriota bacterium]
MKNSVKLTTRADFERDYRTLFLCGAMKRQLALFVKPENGVGVCAILDRDRFVGSVFSSILPL